MVLGCLKKSFTSNFYLFLIESNTELETYAWIFGFSFEHFSKGTLTVSINATF